MATDPRGKLLKLLEAERDLDEDYGQKKSALKAEMFAILRGEDGIGVKLRRVKEFWCATWQERYHEPCDFDHKVNTGHLKRWLITRSEADLCAKMFSYIKSDEPFYVRARHPFSIFVKNFNAFEGAKQHIEDENDSTRTMEALRGE